MGMYQDYLTNGAPVGDEGSLLNVSGSPIYQSYAAVEKARETNPIVDAIYKAAEKAGIPTQFDQTWMLQLAEKAPQFGLTANSDWNGMLQKTADAQAQQYGGFNSPVDAANIVPKFADINGIVGLKEQYNADPRTQAIAQAGSALSAVNQANDPGAGFFTSGPMRVASMALGGQLASMYGGAGGVDYGGAFDSTAIGGGNTLAGVPDAAWGVNARDGGGMYDNLYGDSADLIDAYGGNQSTLGNVDEFGNNIYGGQTPLGGTEYNDFGGDPLGGTNNAPIPAEGIQKLVDAGVPWEIASKMSVSGLKSLMSMAQSNGGGSGGNNPWAGLLAAGLGVLGSNQQTNSLNNLSKQFAEYGAPSRARYESSYQPGFTMANDPGFTDALNLTGKASAHAQSVTGNPTGSANAQTQINKDIFSQFAYPALQNYRSQNANAGGISSFNSAAPSAATSAVASQGNMYNALGAGINDIFNPKPTLAQSMADYQRLSQAF